VDAGDSEVSAPIPDIVVGVDGSAASNAALRWATHEAMLRMVPLRLVNVVSTPMVTYPAAPVPVTMQDWQKDQARQIIRDADELVREIADEAGRTVSVAGTDIIDAPRVQTLIDLSKDTGMIVVGSRGHGAFHRGLLGSVSTALVHHAQCPVAVIHDAPARRRDAPVVLGVDGSEVSDTATGIAFEEAARRDVELIAVHAWSDTTLIAAHAWGDGGLLAESATDWAATSARAEAMLAQRVGSWQSEYPGVAVRKVVVCDRPAHFLAEEAENAQLLVVGSHGRGGFTGMLLGSVSTKLAHTVRVPLVVARKT
jgi:nucleotide-binding universal stress UspA family protein